MADPPAISSATVRDHVDVVQSAALRELLLVIDFQEDTLIAAADRVAAPAEALPPGKAKGDPQLQALIEKAERETRSCSPRGSDK